MDPVIGDFWSDTTCQNLQNLENNLFKKIKKKTPLMFLFFRSTESLMLFWGWGLGDFWNNIFLWIKDVD